MTILAVSAAIGQDGPVVVVAAACGIRNMEAFGCAKACGGVVPAGVVECEVVAHLVFGLICRE